MDEKFSQNRIFSFNRGVSAGAYLLWQVHQLGYVWDNDLQSEDNHMSEETLASIESNPLIIVEKAPWLIANKASNMERRYAPFRETNLHRRFGRLSNNLTPEAIKKFADRYGFLGHSATLFNPEEKIRIDDCPWLPEEESHYYQGCNKVGSAAQDEL